MSAIPQELKHVMNTKSLINRCKLSHEKYVVMNNLTSYVYGRLTMLNKPNKIFKIKLWEADMNCEISEKRLSQMLSRNLSNHEHTQIQDFSISTSTF